MDPISAVAFSLIVSWVVVNAAWEAGVDQAKAEARHTAEAIRKDLQKRRTAWAKQLEKRLADGRKGGPATALWWGWAALRTAKAVRRLMRREPRAAERAISGPTGPARRIFSATWRGAKYAREEARRQRATREKTTRTPVGVCERCGAIAAKTALVITLTRLGRQARMCASCRAAIEAERQQDEATSQTPQTHEPDVADADVVHDPVAAIGQPEPEDIPSSGTTDDTTKTKPQEPQATVKVERVYEPPKAQPALSVGERPADSTAPEGEGMPRQIAPARGGTVATRNTTMTRRSGGEGHTHGQWHHATNDIHRRLEQLPALLEAMLASLKHEAAGRSQVNGVMGIYHGAHNFMGELKDMLRVVSAKEKPVVEAVTVAGGPDEIPNIGYFREI